MAENCRFADHSIASACHIYYYQYECKVAYAPKEILKYFQIVLSLVGIFNNTNSLLLFSQLKYNTGKPEENLFPFILRWFYQANLILSFVFLVLVMAHDDTHIETSPHIFVDIVKFIFMTLLTFEKGLIAYISVIRLVYCRRPQFIISINAVYASILAFITLGVLCMGLNLPFLLESNLFHDHIANYFMNCLYLIVVSMVVVTCDAAWKLYGYREDSEENIMRLSQTSEASDPKIGALSEYILYSGILFVFTTCFANLVYILPSYMFSFGTGCTGCPAVMFISWLMLVADSLFNNLAYYMINEKYRSDLKVAISRTLIYVLSENSLRPARSTFVVTTNGETVL